MGSPCGGSCAAAPGAGRELSPLREHRDSQRTRPALPGAFHLHLIFLYIYILFL